MTTQYATLDQFTATYSLKDVSSTQIGVWLQQASVKLNELLGRVYPTPFASTNATARDLTIDLAYYRGLLRTRNPTDTSELRTELKDRIDALVRGTSIMVLDDGTIVERTAAAGLATSTTAGYNPTFDMREAYEQRVDPNFLDYLNDRDGV